ncbi:MAG TPA: LLM class flavin-dependent oxidoreductase [Acidimicrobiales bacterium]|nr:LLM class flavin-dependent oxidoreductase [Acidimicrobiales bacterium]
MHVGLALPQYDFSVPGVDPLDWDTLVHWATAAEAKGFDSLWLSDHIGWSIDKYGGPPGLFPGFDPIPTLAALARRTTTARLGTLVLATPVRPPTVAAKALTGIDLVSQGRLTVGLGAGWFEPDYDQTGQVMPPPKERLARLAEAVDVMRGCFAIAPDTPFDYDGRFLRADGLRNKPAPVQQPSPPIWLGGRGPKLVELAAAKADGWNTCWQWTPEDYAPRAAHARQAAAQHGKGPDDFTLSLGLYTLVGEDQKDLERRFERLKATAPSGTISPTTTLADYRLGRLVGTIAEVRQQLQRWADLGVALVIACLGAVPFSVTDPDDLDPVVAAVS